MKLLVSACLMGLCTRYDGQACPSAQVLALSNRYTLIPVCPEQLGELPTPRNPCEIRQGRVVSKSGKDMTGAYMKGAEQALLAYRMTNCEAAVLKRMSPSCGRDRVYDGNFTNTIVPGNGLLAGLLMDEGIPVFGEDQTDLIA